MRLHLVLVVMAGLILGGPAVAASTDPDMGAINGMDRVAFVQKFGGIFEKSPWVAEQAWDRGSRSPAWRTCTRPW